MRKRKVEIDISEMEDLIASLHAMVWPVAWLCICFPHDRTTVGDCLNQVGDQIDDSLTLWREIKERCLSETKEKR